MKPGAWIYAACALFWAACIPTYWLLTHEPAGVVGFSCVTCFALLVSLYLAMTARRAKPSAADRSGAEPADGAGEYGFFPPNSWAPLYAATAIGVICLGTVFGWWLLVIGAGLGLLALNHWIFEYYRGQFAH